MVAVVDGRLVVVGCNEFRRRDRRFSAEILSTLWRCGASLIGGCVLVRTKTVGGQVRQLGQKVAKKKEKDPSRDGILFLAMPARPEWGVVSKG